jgi:hypothetical protein
MISDSRKKYLIGWRNKSKLKISKSCHLYYMNNKQKLKVKRKLYRENIREKVLDAYGAFCICCGETEKEFLSLDHIKGGGHQHKKSRPGDGVYLDVIKEDFPKDKYQILCMNCNFAKGHNKICPHQKINILKLVVNK